MLRFAILRHDWPSPHFDLLLEEGDACRTWRLAAEPRGEVYGDLIADHRKHYLDYEGPVSGDRGRVTRWDFGSYRQIDFDGDPEEIVFEFKGQILVGFATWNRETRCWTFPAG